MFNTTKELAADIAKELREHPGHWTTHAAAKDASGAECSADDPDAVSWCLFGHIEKRGIEPYHADIARPFFSIAGLDYQTDSYACINDARTVEQIIQICDAVAATDC